jgi:glycosyltransferase involved in cell wall biosynthesis
MRILLVSFIDNNQWTGMGKWTYRMAEGLESLGHQVRLWFANDFPFLWKNRRIAVLVFPIVLAFRLVRLRHCFDVVVIHEPSGFWYSFLRRYFSSLPPSVVMCHNVESKHFKEMLEASDKGLASISQGARIKVPLFRRWQSDGAIKVADHCVCLSSVDRDYLIKVLRCRPDKVTTLINGVAGSRPSVERLSTTHARVLFVGGWLDVKGRNLLPSIWPQVLSRFPNATLTLIGTGCSVEDVKQDFPEAVGGSIRVIPRVSTEEEMICQYRSHDLFLMPSLSEGSPLALLEAMSEGLPIVATSVGGIKDIMTGALGDPLFDPALPEVGVAKVCFLLSNPDVAARLGRAGQDRARELTWAASAQTLEGALQVTLMRANKSVELRSCKGGSEESTGI